MSKEKVHVSVIIPAHNEEKYVERCIQSVKESAKRFKGNVEIIVVCNRCSDMTGIIALANGARVLENEDKCIALVRNTGIKAAKGKVIVTIDCDNRMTPGTISEIWKKLRSGEYIGGGASIRFERYSFPLWLNDMMCRIGFAITGLHCGIMWAKKETFDAIGGFADKRAMEDVETAKRLRSYGKKKGKKYGVLKKNYLINSTRKYDELLDEMFYEYNDRH